MGLILLRRGGVTGWAAKPWKVKNHIFLNCFKAYLDLFVSISPPDWARVTVFLARIFAETKPLNQRCLDL